MLNKKDMKDLEKRLSIIEEKLGIVNLENQFEKKEGRWYKATYKSKYLVYAEKLDGNDVIKGYGFCDSGKWRNFIEGEAFILNAELATNQEVEYVLSNYAISLGIKKGNTIKIDGFSILIKSEPKIVYNEISNSLNIYCRHLYFYNEKEYDEQSYLNILYNGEWIFRLVEQPSSLEQDIQQLKDKYKQYKFTITIEDNV